MKIAKIIKSPNTGELNGKTLKTFNVRFLFSDNIKKTEQLELESGTFHWGETDGFISFGYDSKTEKPGHGGLWSSNSKAFREYVGIETVEVTFISHEKEFCGSVIHVRKDALESVLPSEYKVVRLDSGFDSVVEV